MVNVVIPEPLFTRELLQRLRAFVVSARVYSCGCVELVTRRGGIVFFHCLSWADSHFHYTKAVSYQELKSRIDSVSHVIECSQNYIQSRTGKDACVHFYPPNLHEKKFRGSQLGRGGEL